MSTVWERELRDAEKTALIKDNRRKIHFTFRKDGSEMVEEYDMSCCQLFVRKWRRSKGVIGKFGEWEFEVGEPNMPVQAKMLNDGMSESSGNPILVREDSQKAFQFRIRNLPWPKDNYEVALNPTEYAVIISTKNKKYYKKLYLADLKRLGIAPSSEHLRSSYANNTLIVQYEKSPAIIQFEQRLRSEYLKMKASKDGDVDQCAPS